MTIQSVIKMGNQQLFTPSLPVDKAVFGSDYLFNIIEDMKDTMNAKGGVGIAAPQIGINMRIILFGFETSKRYPNEKPVPLTTLINPVIEILTDEMIDGWEGCLSVPGLRGLVPRYKEIKYTGYDQNGDVISRTADGFHARMLQHECDHLDGILFPQRIKEMKYFGFEDEIEY